MVVAPGPVMWRSSRSSRTLLYFPTHPVLERRIVAYFLASRIRTTMSADKCPVDHSSISSQNKGDACPVDHSTRSTWSNLFPRTSSTSQTAASSQVATPHSPSLSTDRETSSIPRNEAGERWVYPSEAQFFAAMARKNHNPQAQDMRVIVPIHNAVNERAWGQILDWERGRGGETCGGARLVSFKGRPRDLTPKARFKALMG